MGADTLFVCIFVSQIDIAFVKHWRAFHWVYNKGTILAASTIIKYNSVLNKSIFLFVCFCFVVVFFVFCFVIVVLIFIVIVFSFCYFVIFFQFRVLCSETTRGSLLFLPSWGGASLPLWSVDHIAPRVR